MQGRNRYNIRTPLTATGANVEQTTKKSWRNKRLCSKYQCSCQVDTESWFQAENLSCPDKMCNWPLHWVFIFFCFNAWIYGLQSYQYFQKLLHQSVRSDFGKKWHLTASVVVLQCLLRLLIIFSYYMKREKIFARIFSKVESLPQQKGFIIRSREITSKCFWQKKLVPPTRSNKELNNIDMNRNVLGELVSYSMNSDYKIDFEEALKYPLAKIQPSLCHADRTKWSSSKSDLLTALDIQYSPADVIQDY